MNVILDYAKYYSCVLKRPLTQLGEFKEVYINKVVQEYSFLFNVNILFEYTGWVLNSE